MWFIKASFLIYVLSTASAVDFYCQFSGAYICKVYNVTVPFIDEAYVSSVSGTHLTGKTNADVNTLDTRGLVIRYFPQLLHLFFPNLARVYIEGGMYELHKEDLQFLPKLTTLYMSYNNIEYLEKDLFVNNPSLQLIYFEVNNIKYVDPNVFDSLTGLTVLSLRSNNCFYPPAAGSRTAVLSLINDIKSSCGEGANPQVQTINELQSQLEQLVLVNGNLTAKCSQSTFTQNGGAIIL